LEKKKERLAEKSHWDETWENLSPPLRVNKLRYSEYRFAKLFERALENERRRDIKVLEVGCGGSRWMPLFYRELKVKGVFGFDYSQIGCRVTQANLEFLGAQEAARRVVCGDIFNPPFKEESFDVVYSLGFIEHFEHPDDILKLMAGLLKPGGLLITVVPNYVGLTGRVAERVDPNMYRIHRKITLEEFAAWHRALKLGLVKIGYFGSFSLTASVIWSHFERRSPAHKICSRILTRVINVGITLPLRVIPLEMESRLFSPHLAAVARK
jgi:SAM-dependent methyltransferase